jgi:hypothetical protein
MKYEKTEFGTVIHGLPEALKNSIEDWPDEHPLHEQGKIIADQQKRIAELEAENARLNKKIQWLIREKNNRESIDGIPSDME